MLSICQVPLRLSPPNKQLLKATAQSTVNRPRARPAYVPRQGQAGEAVFVTAVYFDTPLTHLFMYVPRST